MNIILTASMSVLAYLAAGTLQPAKDAPAPGQPAAPAQPGEQPAKKPMPAGHPGVINNDPTINWPKAKAEDVSSVDAILAAFYSVPAGEPGQARDWDRYRSLFSPDARLIPARADAKGGAMAMFVTITDYISLNKNYFEKGGFRDKEVARQVQSYGHIAQVWSTFESRRKADDADPYIRGINSIQLLKDGDRWWIVNVFWDLEDGNAPIPAEFLKSPSAK